MPAESVPGQIADDTMVLVAVVAIVSKDQVRIQVLSFFIFSNDSLILAPS